MIKAKIQKINEDDKTVLLLTEHGDELYASRYDIDFGIIEGDSLFLKTESGEYKFRRLEKDEAQEGESHYYDVNWNARELEHQAVIAAINLATAELNLEIAENEVKAAEEAMESASIQVVAYILVVAAIVFGVIVFLTR